MPICIYCRNSDAEFSREHVLPYAFGTYGDQTMVMPDKVCKACNAKLGSILDQVLARDSFEGLLRAELLGQTDGKPDRFKSRRVRIEFPDQDCFGILRGARIDIDWSTRTMVFPDQIVMRNTVGKVHSFTGEEFAAIDENLLKDLPKGAVKVLANTKDQREALTAVVLSRGLKMGEGETVEVPSAARGRQVAVETMGVIDERTWRAIAKIAFNYLAHIEGANYVLHERFDPVRDFINGSRLDRAMVRVLNEPILSDEDNYWRAFPGHLVLFKRVGHGLRGRLSLFNSMTYEVMLCANLGLHYQMFSGHGFDPFDHTILPLTRTTHLVMP